jgi:putative Mn2+ efflux pump MntP
MTDVVGLSVLLGLDNLRVTVGLGMLGLDRSTRGRLVLWFAGMEAAAPIAGFALGRAAPPVEWVAPAALAACGVFVLVGVASGAQVGRWLAAPLAMMLLPGLFALDNLAAGIGLGSAGMAVGSAVVAGCASAVWSMVGLTIGSRLGRLPLPSTPVAGGVLLGSAILTVLA